MDPLSMPTDPFGIAGSFFKIQQAWLYNGAELLGITSRLSASIQAAGAEQFASALSEESGREDPAGQPGDRPARCGQKLLEVCQQAPQRLCDVAQRLCEQGPGHSGEGTAALGILGQSTHYPRSLRPTASGQIRRSFKSLCTPRERAYLRAIENWIEDVQRGDNLIRIADTGAFKVGQNIATTPGFVIFRNRLMELIQYSPRTESVFATPVVFIQPWINKYYILDMTKKKASWHTC